MRDRATLFNLAVGLNGYTVCSGVISHELNGENIISVPLDVDETMTIGIITRRNTTPTRYGKAYREAISPIWASEKQYADAVLRASSAMAKYLKDDMSRTL